MAVKARKNYPTNDDLVVALAQAGDYVREHAADLIGKAIGDDLSCARLEVKIVFEPNSLVQIQTVKDHKMKVIVPFSEGEETDGQ